MHGVIYDSDRLGVRPWSYLLILVRSMFEQRIYWLGHESMLASYFHMMLRFALVKKLLPKEGSDLSVLASEHLLDCFICLLLRLEILAGFFAVDICSCHSLHAAKALIVASTPASVSNRLKRKSRSAAEKARAEISRQFEPRSKSKALVLVDSRPCTDRLSNSKGEARKCDSEIGGSSKKPKANCSFPVSYMLHTVDFACTCKVSLLQTERKIDNGFTGWNSTTKSIIGRRSAVKHSKN